MDFLRSYFITITVTPELGGPIFGRSVNPIFQLGFSSKIGMPRLGLTRNLFSSGNFSSNSSLLSIKYHIYQKCLSWLHQAKLMKKNFKILSLIVIPTIKDIFRNFQNLNINHLHRKQKKNSKQHLNSTAMYVNLFSIIFYFR